MEERAARKIRILSLILVGSLMLLIGVRVAVTWYIRAKDAAIRPPLAVLNEGNAQSSASEPRVYPLPDDLRSALRQANGFQVRHRIADIPPSVRAAFAKAAHEEFSMAEPGAKWQSTDVVIEPRLPWRRLTALAASATFCLVFYERGGIGKSNNVAVFRLSSGGAEPVWHAYLDDRVADPASLSVAIEEKKIYIGAAFF